MTRQIKVGAFVLFALALCGVAIFLIGDSRRLWESKVKYKAAFADVAGLKPGSPIRMGGLDVGTVTSVGHADNAGDTRIYVTFAVDKAEAARVREDTIARVAPKGLLGDKMIEFTVADGKMPPQDPDAPGPFRYAEAHTLLTVLDEAGFRELHVHDWRGALALGGGLPAAAAATFALETLSSYKEQLDEVGDAAMTGARESLTSVLRAHERSGAVRMEACVRIVTGTRPRGIT